VAGPQEGRWLLAAGNAGGVVSVWDLRDRVPRGVMRGSQYEVLALAFSPDGATLASCGRFAVKLWDLATGRHLLDATGGNYLVSLSFSPDGRRLAVGRMAAFGHAGGVDVWELGDGRGIRTFRGLVGKVEKLVVSPGGDRLAALGHDWQVAIWDRRDGRLLHLLDAPVGSFATGAALAFSPEGRRLAVSAGRAATLWDADAGTKLRSWELPEGLDGSLTYAGEGRLLLARVETKDGRVGPFAGSDPREHPRVAVVRDLLGAGEAPLAVIADANRYVHSLLLTPDGETCVLQGIGGDADRPRRIIRVYEARTGQPLWDVPTQRPADDLGGDMKLDPTGRFLTALLAPDAHPTLLDLATRQSLGLQPTPISALAPGARRWLDALALFDRDRPEALVTFLADGGGGGAPLFSPDGRFIYWCGPEGTIQVVDVSEVQGRLAGLGLGW
jgi:WD40 repeat protein